MLHPIDGEKAQDIIEYRFNQDRLREAPQAAIRIQDKRNW
jgi:hypothetical protein